MIFKFLLRSIIFLSISKQSIGRRNPLGNNACNNFEDYFKASISPNCFYNPDMFLETVSFLICPRTEFIEIFRGKINTK
jgi:hypothetical protein